MEHQPAGNRPTYHTLATTDRFHRSNFLYMRRWNYATVGGWVDRVATRAAGEAVDMGGICQLGEDIGVDAATDVSILVLCWKLGAKAKPGHVMEAEWMEGMEGMAADSTDKVGEVERVMRVR